MTILETLNSRIYSIFPALSHANFRWFWLGQIISLIGTWTQNIGQAWLVLQITDSPLLLGVVTAVQFAPVMLFSLYAGAWIDRLPKRRVIISAQVGLMLLAFTLAIIVGLGILRYWMLLLLALLLGIVNTVDTPARQSFMIELVGREHLANAIALNSAIFNGARLIGPAIAAIIMAAWGPMWCFLINGISFIGVIAILRNMPERERERHAKQPSQAIGKEILDGLGYIRANVNILFVMVLLFFLSIVAMNFNVLIPILAKYDLQEQVLGFGILMSTMGIGALLGALTVAGVSRRGPQKKMLLTGAFGLGLFSFLLSWVDEYHQAAIVLVLLGWSMIVFTASANSTVQLSVDNRFRGRVMSVYSLLFGGMVPIGSLYAGILANQWGARTAFGINGILSLIFVTAIVIWRRNHKGGEVSADRGSV